MVKHLLSYQEVKCSNDVKNHGLIGINRLGSDHTVFKQIKEVRDENHGANWRCVGQLV